MASAVRRRCPRGASCSSRWGAGNRCPPGQSPADASAAPPDRSPKGQEPEDVDAADIYWRAVLAHAHKGLLDACKSRPLGVQRRHAISCALDDLHVIVHRLVVWPRWSLGGRCPRVLRPGRRADAAARGPSPRGRSPQRFSVASRAPPSPSSTPWSASREVSGTHVLGRPGRSRCFLEILGRPK